MIVSDNDLETKKFIMYAEKADTEKKRIELCKKYLASKGLDVNAAIEKSILEKSFAVPKVEPIIVNRNDIEFLEQGVGIDIDQYSDPTRKMAVLIEAKKALVQDITHTIIQKNLIKFDEWKDPMVWQTKIRARVGIWKGKL